MTEPMRTGRGAMIELIKRFAELPLGGEFIIICATRNCDDAFGVIVKIEDFTAVFTRDEARSLAATLDAFMLEMPYRQPWNDLAVPLRYAADTIEQPRHSVH